MSRSGLQRQLVKRTKIEAAINNEHLTRQRVETLENEVVQLRNRLDHEIRRVREALAAHVKFWGRLRWLVTGR